MKPSLSNRNLLVGISGGIAAYKSAELVRLLRKQGANVRVVMTQGAKAFITPLTLQALSGHPVYDDLLDPNAEAAMGHIQLARWTDAIIIAPASANTLARLANGHADDLLSTLCLASQAPIALAPAMNQQMWQASATQANVARLQERGIQLWGPADGEQACGEIGPGRMLEVDILGDLIADLFASQALQGLRVLVTAGPTREAIDPVRYISNHSSGKMGYALAQAALDAGAQVTLVSGPVHLQPPERLSPIYVESAGQMHDAVFSCIEQHDIFISVAAVADYTCSNPAMQKLSKHDTEFLLQLRPTVDILGAVGKLKDRPYCVGFSAQTHDVVELAQEKRRRKNIDLIAANEVGGDCGFHSDDNTLTVITATGQQKLPHTSKAQLAHQLIAIIAEEFHAKHSS